MLEWTEGTGAAPINTCDEIDTRYFHDVHIYVGNSTSISSASYCGVAGISYYLTGADLIYGD